MSRLITLDIGSGGRARGFINIDINLEKNIHYKSSFNPKKIEIFQIPLFDKNI